MKAARPLLFVLCALPCGAAHAQAADPCTDAYNAEVTRIQREARQHDGSEKAKQRAARLAESQSRLAASRAQQCRSERSAAPAAAAKGPAGSAKAAGAKPRTSAEGDRIESQCYAEAAKRNAELDRRYLGRRLMQVEQVKYREEQARIKAGIPECVRLGR